MVCEHYCDHVFTHLYPFILKYPTVLLYTSQLSGRSPICTRLCSFLLYFSLKVLLTYHSYKDTHHYVHCDVPSGHICNYTFYYTHHGYMNAHQYVHVDVP